MDAVYQHRIYNDFSKYPDTEDVLHQGGDFAKQWMLYDLYVPADNPDIRLNTYYSPVNVKIRDGNLVLTQDGYTEADRMAGNPVRLAGLQTRDVDILYGTFRTVLKLSESNGGSCAGFFWYHDDRSEIDIEAVTDGDSLVNNTINYTNQPSIDAHGVQIPNATLSIPLRGEYDATITNYHEHRFDSSPDGVAFFLDGKAVKTDNHSIAQYGGSLQMKLWADGNKWWSGSPSTTDVHLYVQSIITYYNSSQGQSDNWVRECNLAGGPSKDTVCDGQLEVTGHAQSMLA